MGSNPAEGANLGYYMKKYRFVSQEEQPDGSIVDMEYTLSEEEIFQGSWTYWYNKIWTVETPNTVVVRDMPLALQRQKCIEDYVTVHWGVEVKD